MAQIEGHSRRVFIQQLFARSATAAATPGSVLRALSVPAITSDGGQAALPGPSRTSTYTLEDAADCICDMFTNRKLTAQIIYAARATRMAHAIIRTLVSQDRVFSRADDGREDPEFLSLDERLFPFSLHLAVALSLSGGLFSESNCSGVAVPFQTDPRILNAVRIVSLGIPMEGGLFLPIYSPRSNSNFDCTEYPPDSTYQYYLCKEPPPTECWINRCCREALRSGMDPLFSSLFKKVLRERFALAETLSQRAIPPDLDLSLPWDSLFSWRARGTEEGSATSWDNLFAACGGTLGLAVNLPLYLDAIRAYENRFVTPSSLHARIVQAITAPTSEGISWLSALPEFQYLKRVQEILALVPNLYHPPIEVLLRHGRTLQAAVDSLTNHGFPSNLIISPLEEYRHSEELTRLLGHHRALLENLLDTSRRDTLLDRPQWAHLPPLPSASILCEANMQPPARILVDNEIPVNASAVRHVALKYPDHSCSLWQHVSSDTGEVFVSELS